MNLYGLDIISVPGMKENRVILTQPLVRLKNETDEKLALRYIQEGKAIVMDTSLKLSKLPEPYEIKPTNEE